MKRIIILTVVLFAVFNLNAEAKRHYHGVSGYFYTELSPYGTWIEIDYGVVVWRPTIIHVNWMPYQTGRWIWTYDGWYWDSYEPFGFITYHYGRWYYDDYYGWLWYPDYEWAPAWVEWRYDDNYIGWAPLHPYAYFTISFGIQFTNVYYTPYYHWHFVTYNYFCDPYVYNYYVAPDYRYRIYNGTKYRSNYSYYDGRIQNRGVDVNYVRKRSGQEIKQRDLIRVRDSRDLSRDSYKGRDEIRTLDLKREDLTKNNLGRMEIKHESRKTSLEVEKVKIGERENRTSDIKREKKLETNTDNIRNIQTGDEKNDVLLRDSKSNKNEITRKDNNVELKKRESVQTKNPIETTRKNDELNTRIEKQTKEQKTEVRREDKKDNNNDQMKRDDVREKSNDQNQRTSNDKRVNTDRPTGQDNSRERSRR